MSNLLEAHVEGVYWQRYFGVKAFSAILDLYGTINERKLVSNFFANDYTVRSRARTIVVPNNLFLKL